MKTKTLFTAVVFSILFTSFSPHSASAVTVPQNAASQNIFLAEKFYRTELYFGMNRPGGAVVTDEEWSKFLADEVTPRFPEGFTVLDGYGQFKNKSGKIVKEKSRVLILLYPKKSIKDANLKIEEMRTAYTKTFQQQSVLRMDIVQNVRVSF